MKTEENDGSRGKRLTRRAALGTAVKVGVGVLGVAYLASKGSLTFANAEVQSTISPNVVVFATGLNNPRGIKFKHNDHDHGDDKNLYVAEGGIGGTNSTVGICDQVPAPVGPYTGSNTGSRISKISPRGVVTTVVDNLPSSQTSPALGSFISGVGDIVFNDRVLYAVLAGAGCSHGVPDIPNAIIRVNSDGTTTQVADLSAFLKANPVANPEPDDFEPDGTWYSLTQVEDALYAIEPNHGELDRITRDGTISRVTDISATQGHIVPTAMTFHAGNFYVGNLGVFPATVGGSKVMRITPKGELSVFAEGFTTIVGVAFDELHRLYVLEMSAPAPQPGPPIIPGTGRVLRIGKSGDKDVIATGLTFPTAMTFGRGDDDGSLYVSNFGFGFPPGSGQIVRITV